MSGSENKNNSLKSAFLVLILLILAMGGAGYLSRNALFTILERYSKDFGTFVIYTGFVGVSLIAAVVVFGIMRSTGVFKKTGKQGYQYEFGGAMAGFLATLVFLITSYSAPAPTALQITGNVRFAENGKPVGPAVGANVALSGHSGFQTETDRNGNFSLSIPDNQQIQDIELIITYEDKTDYHTVKRSETENIIIRLERTPGHNSGRTKSWFIVENPVLRSDAEMIIKPGKGAAKRFKPLNIEFDEILFSKKGIPVAEKDVKKKVLLQWVFSLKDQDPPEDMTKQGYHIVRIGFPGEKLSKPYKIVFKNKPPVLRVENLPLETDPDGRIIKGKAASEFQIPGETISVELVYFHEGASQEINVPVSTIVDDKTGICYFEFETAIRGLPKIPADDPRYAEPFFGFKITDQAKNYYYQEQSYAQYMAPGANRFGFNNLAMINVEKLTEDEELKNIIRLTPMKSPLQHLTDGRPAIRIEVTGSTKTSRFVKIRSNVKDRLPMTLVLRDEKQLGMTTTDEYVDKEKLDAEKAEYRVEQEGADGAKYSSNTVSVSDSETTVAGIYRLRSKPKTLSDDDVKAMLKNHNFYDRDWNNSGNFKNSFMNNEDGTVTDTVTGLMWQKSGSDAYITYDKAQAYIDDLNNRKFADYNDWRLPTLEELASLLENKEVDGLYIDLKFDRKQKWCWTADKRASGGAWYVYFNDGFVGWLSLDFNDYVRGVRSRTM